MPVKVLNQISGEKVMAILARYPNWMIFSNPFEVNKNEIIVLCAHAPNVIRTALKKFPFDKLWQTILIIKRQKTTVSYHIQYILSNKRCATIFNNGTNIWRELCKGTRQNKLLGFKKKTCQINTCFFDQAIHKLWMKGMPFL